MIKTTIPANPFEQFLSSYEENSDSIDYQDEIRSILVYIGLFTVILCFFLLLFSLIGKCLKILNDETISTAQKTQVQFKYRPNFSASRQTSVSSISSASSLINYHSSSKPSLSTTIRMLQYKEQQLSPIVHV
ncbi:unnamed protein product [Adineta steineri]|uniref:Uncharacterized protein n=1 Tax=Adineta steineri TaxID=433720 RepID=A0A815DUJ0_9BILA|nr:unnamed protein product [Adineta steineri]